MSFHNLSGSEVVCGCCLICVVTVCLIQTLFVTGVSLVSFHSLSSSDVVCDWCFFGVFSQFVWFRGCLWLMFVGVF